jgi:GMP synthase-like glutamine amidotransferase
MKAHYIQHVPFEGLGSIESWLRGRGDKITSTRPYESADFPDLSEFELLVVMGGPMSVNEETENHWLRGEKQFIRDAIAADKLVLGICLGAQLIASALGASVSRGEHKEIGWFPITGIKPSTVAGFVFPDDLDVFHWHGDTFELPESAIRLAASEACVNQAFQVGRNIIGLQFHLETTPRSARQIISNCRDELVPSRYVQTEPELLSVSDSKYDVINATMSDLLTYLVGKR